MSKRLTKWPKLEKGGLYEVWWEDASTYAGWNTERETTGSVDPVCKTAGWFMGYNKNGTPNFAGTVSIADGQGNGTAARPKAMIVAVFKLDKKKKKLYDKKGKY